MQTDEHFRAVKMYRTAINRMIKQRSSRRSKHVPFEASALRTWIDFARSADMSPENYGMEWCLDHVIPLSESEDIHDYVWMWWNIQPVPVSYNTAKNKYIDHEQLQSHLEKLREYDITIYDKYKENVAKHLVAGSP